MRLPHLQGQAYVGSPTTAHKARYELWCWLWCRTACNPNPSNNYGGQA